MRKTFIALFVFVVSAPVLLAFNPQPDPPAFAAIGITSSQTARLNLYAKPTSGEVAPGPCDGLVQLRFVDLAGRVLAQRSARMTAETSEWLEFPAPRDLALGTRVEVRGDVSWVTVQPGPCRLNLLGNVEVFNNATGQTQFVLPGAQLLPAVQDQQGK